jgi:hypothetical protein
MTDILKDVNNAKDTQSRKWMLTINNPITYGLTHDKLKDIFVFFTSLIYWCMSDEVGECGTYHTHVYLCFSSAVRFSTLKEKFGKEPHLQMCKGKSAHVRDYVYKEGKWLTDKKAETNLKETHEESGDVPAETQGKRNDMVKLYEMIKDGLDNYQICEADPSQMFNIDKIERVRQMLNEEKYKNIWRDLEVTYITGQSGAGKSRGVREFHGFDKVYVVTDYQHPFDRYKGEDVILFEEFRSSLKISDMLNYLDGYPLQLPCRYTNKVACYTKVFISTNWELHEQYPNEQVNHPSTFQAFLRRIKKIRKYTDIGVFQETDFDYKKINSKNEWLQKAIKDCNFFDDL